MVWQTYATGLPRRMPPHNDGFCGELRNTRNVNSLDKSWFNRLLYLLFDVKYVKISGLKCLK